MHNQNERKYRAKFALQEKNLEGLSNTHEPADKEINLIDYFRVIYKYRWMILTITIVAMAVAIGLSLRKPRMYQASTSIVPPIDMLSRGSGLAGKLGAGSSMLLQGVLNEGDLSGVYVAILESRAISDALIDRFDLMHTYGTATTRTGARNILNANTTIKASKDGIVHVTVNDRDAKRAAMIANAYVEEMDKKNKELSSGQASSKRIFLEKRLKEVQDELSKIDSLQTREAQIKEMLFEMLTKEYEVAKIEEAKSMPTIQVLDPAVAPEQPLARGTISKGMAAGAVVFLFGVILSFVREYIKNVVIR